MKSIKNFLREIIIVVIGVLIAVSINNYREKQQNDVYIQKTLSAIENEIKLSKEEVSKVMKKHFLLLDTLKSNLKNDQESIGALISRLNGIQGPNIKNIGLRFFISNKAELVDFSVIAQLSEIESNVDLLHEKMKRLIDFIYEVINDKDEESKIKLTYFISNVIDSEQTLLKLYNEFIMNHNTPSNTNPELEKSNDDK